VEFGRWRAAENRSVLAAGGDFAIRITGTSVTARPGELWLTTSLCAVRRRGASAFRNLTDCDDCQSQRLMLG
jgi:hypothetical protein